MTPSSTWAAFGSSDSLWGRTVLPQRVFTNVVLPIGGRFPRQVIVGCGLTRKARLGGDEVDIPVPEAPQTIKQNWIPFLTFFFRRIIFCILKRGKGSAMESIQVATRDEVVDELSR